MREILARAQLPESPGCMSAEIVLCHLPHNNCTPFVTWQHNLRYGDSDGFYWGHYFRDQHEAREDFITRCNERGAL